MKTVLMHAKMRYPRTMSCALVLLALFMAGRTVSDRAALEHGLVRLHVVANSDSPADQSCKLYVKDGIVSYLDALLFDCEDIQQAKRTLTSALPQLQKTACDLLRQCGSQDSAVVKLCTESFPLRQYDTFRLPAGVYQSLRVVIGKGRGHNWWCVVYPQLCSALSVEGLKETSSDAIPSGLVSTLAGTQGTQIRFYLLDQLGRLENKIRSH